MFSWLFFSLGDSGDMVVTVVTLGNNSDTGVTVSQLLWGTSDGNSSDKFDFATLQRNNLSSYYRPKYVFVELAITKMKK